MWHWRLVYRTMLKIQLCITGISYIWKYNKIEKLFYICNNISQYYSFYGRLCFDKNINAALVSKREKKSDQTQTFNTTHNFCFHKVNRVWFHVDFKDELCFANEFWWNTSQDGWYDHIRKNKNPTSYWDSFVFFLSSLGVGEGNGMLWREKEDKRKERNDG